VNRSTLVSGRRKARKCKAEAQRQNTTDSNEEEEEEEEEEEGANIIVKNTIWTLI
jgi:ribosomal protein L12E/L44/L45/RPP1/RPP2